MQITPSKDTFNFWLPISAIQKAASTEAEAKDGKRWIQGLASTEDRDLQDETVLQNGIDHSYFLKHGYINDDHKSGPENKVGEPTECRLTKAGLWIKGFLYKGHARADYWWEFLNALDQSGSTRKVGFSIQGKIVRREGKSILKCWLQDVAITAAPVNTSTWAEIVKSLRGERWCTHPWKSLEKSCKGCPGESTCAAEQEEKALSAGGQGRVLAPQSLEGGMKVQTFKSVTDRVTFNDAVQEIATKGYTLSTARAMATAIFAQHGNLQRRT